MAAVDERFWSWISPEPNTGCWLWTGHLNHAGYGHFWYRGEQWRAHRASWEMHRGPIPDGMMVLHRCDTPACVNPDHLFIGDQKDNAIDREAKGRGWRGGNGRGQWTHCSHGHEYTAANTWIARSGQRVCRACKRACNAASKKRRRQAGQVQAA